MEVSITSKGKVYSLEVIEDDVTCTLVLSNTHDIITKGKDTNGLADRISYSYRKQVGKEAINQEFLKLIKEDLKRKT